MTPERLIVNPLLEIRLKGTQAQMGAQYGEILAAEGGYEPLLDFYPRMAESLLLSGVPRRLRNGPLRRVAGQLMHWAVNSMSKGRLPQFTERAHAIARAANLSPEMVRHMLVMDVFQNSIGVLGRVGALRQVQGDAGYSGRPLVHALGACTSAVTFGPLSADGELMHARNFDFPGVGVWDKSPTIVYCSPEHGIPYGYIGARGADVPGITAFNAEGLTVTFHTRFHRDVDFTATGVIDLGHEIVSNSRTIEDAINIVSRHKVASTWGIMVTSAKERNAAVIETTAKKMRVTWAKNGRHGQTNHYLHSDMVPGEIATSNGWTSYTVDRLRLLEKFFAEAEQRGGATLTDMQNLLGADFEVDAPGVPRMLGSLIGYVMSVQSVVFKLQSGIVSLSLGEAPTGWGPYYNHEINWSGDALKLVDPAKQKLSAVTAHYASGEALAAYRHFQRAFLTDFQCGPLEQVREHVAQASAYASEDSSLKFVEGALALEAREADVAYRHLVQAAQRETSPYRKAQALLWAARAAAASGRGSEAASLRKEVFVLSHHNIAHFKQAAAKDANQLITKRNYSDMVLSLSMLDAA
ncbi:C45 family autoproteolytic acyltransferase/hydolase [Turneriella parva]|uniref:Peptidase C45 acyl-coenzyme A:6-aminopenicillanic acid acyl-transferase n=1 Tax=Turneriella parva (strain ATCC BAA-1111 / DSM 21527 / NCTC 11395 / H) TaxID=869212 RepID=I4B355_TURPD|nr:C45 family peptidase [Turneriella parva]AFM11712.1 peptidase C45 acyl-coenzyme A:6-aminopenicillanic acid acyl-transferase [Turneriella parva DSM 21527]